MITDPPEVDGFELRALSDADAGGLLDLFSDPEVCAFMDIEPLETEFEALDIIDWAEAQAAQGLGVRWGVRRAGEGRLIGTVGFNRIERSRGRWGEIAYDLARDQWGRGVMSTLLPAIIARGFADFGLLRLEAMVTVGNERSCALLRRMGFQQEGVLARRGYWKGQAWDQLVFARLAD
jgi:ribosomal-protein-alanine N-acetyltransferase